MNVSKYLGATLTGAGSSFLKSLLALSLAAAGFALRAAEGDVTINATSTAEAPCADCPGGKGRKICYEVTLAANAENSEGKDFHVQVNSANAKLFKCFTTDYFRDGQWREVGWSSGHTSQREGGVNRHYVSWYGNSTFLQGETWRFCFVYCGDDNNLDNTIEWLLTNDGTLEPGVPDAKGNRDDVPDTGPRGNRVDDPGWHGTKTNAPGSKTGFLISHHVIDPGIDLFMTPSGGATYKDFRDTPIPANFFDPGSEPFTNIIILQGQPLEVLPPGALHPADTVVRRMDRAIVPFGGSYTVPIELVALSLSSVEPITVTYGGRQTEKWDVRIFPSAAVPQLPGQMTIHGESNGIGGTFTATLPVRARFVFTRASDGMTRDLDLGRLPGQPTIQFQTLNGHWTEAAPERLKLVEAQPGWVIPPPFSPSGQNQPLPGTTDNFHPGVRFDDCAGQPADSLLNKKLTQALAQSAAHGVLPAAPPGADRDGDGIPDDADNCPDSPNPLQEDRDDDGVGDACDNCAALYNPCQENTDGHPGGDACGFQVVLQQGLSTIANNYRRPNNALADLLPNAVEGTTVYLWDAVAQRYKDPYQYLDGFGWFSGNSDDPGPNGPRLEPGRGAWISTPALYTILFGGAVDLLTPLPRPPAGFYFVSCRTPRASNFEQLMGFPPLPGDRLYRFNEPALENAPPPPGAGGVVTYEYGVTGWSPAEPILEVGKAAFVELNGSAANLPPVIQSIAPRSTHAGGQVSFIVAASDPENQPLHWSLEPGAPTGAVIDPTTGLLVWTTGPENLGTNTIGVRVTDSGQPALSSVVTFDMIVAPPMALRAIHVQDGSVVLEWNAIPGHEYVVRSKSNIAADEWDFRAGVVADNTVVTWRDHFTTGTPGLFYDVICYQEGICGCTAMTISHADPSLGRVKFTFGAGDAPETATVEIPFTIVGTIQCSQGSGKCKGEVEVSVSGSWEVIRNNGTHVADVDDPNRGAVKGSDPAVANWNTVHGGCERTDKYSVGAIYSESVDISGLTKGGREALKNGQTRLRGDLNFTITAKCGRNAPVTRTVRLVVDGRMDASTDADAANEINGGFDDDASDYDGDGRNPDGSPFDPSK